MHRLFIGELLRRARIHLKRKIESLNALHGLYEIGQSGDESIATKP